MFKVKKLIKVREENALRRTHAEGSELDRPSDKARVEG